MPYQGRTAPTQCPACGSKLDGFTNTTGTAGPRSGDPTICAYCGALLVFATDDGVVRLPTKPELTAFMAVPEVREAMAHFAHYPGGSL